MVILIKFVVSETNLANALDLEVLSNGHTVVLLPIASSISCTVQKPMENTS